MLWKRTNVQAALLKVEVLATGMGSMEIVMTSWYLASLLDRKYNSGHLPKNPTQLGKRKEKKRKSQKTIIRRKDKSGT